MGKILRIEASMFNVFVFIFGVALGIIIGMLIAYGIMHESLIKLLSHLRIENINIGINETKLVEAMNNTFGGVNGN